LVKQEGLQQLQRGLAAPAQQQLVLPAPPPAAVLASLSVLQLHQRLPALAAALKLQLPPRQHPQQQQLQELLLARPRPAVALMQSRQTLEELARCSWACAHLHSTHGKSRTVTL
jgi:hypothetical protein